MKTTLIFGLILVFSFVLNAGDPIEFIESSWASIGVNNEMRLTKDVRGVIRTKNETLIFELLDSKRFKEGAISTETCSVICVSINDIEVRTDTVKGFAQYKTHGDLAKGDIGVRTLHKGSDELLISEYGLEWVFVSDGEILVKPAPGARYAAVAVEQARQINPLHAPQL